MINIQELIDIQSVTTGRSKVPGIMVISRKKLAKLIQSKIGKPFNVKHLNICVEKYCRGNYALRMNVGSKKYNLIAEKVPPFIEWFTFNWENNPKFYKNIVEEYEYNSERGMNHYRKRILSK